MGKHDTDWPIASGSHPGGLGDDDGAADTRHEPIRHGLVLHHGNVDGTYDGFRGSQDRIVALAKPHGISQPAVVFAPASMLRCQRLSASYPPSTNRAVIYPHDADEAALLDAIDAGDCDRDGNPIPWPRYRGA